MKSSWIGIGFSVHNVPSLSRTAIRSASGTNRSEPSSITWSTKSTIVRRVGVSAQEAKRESPAISAVLLPVADHVFQENSCGLRSARAAISTCTTDGRPDDSALSSVGRRSAGSST